MRELYINGFLIDLYSADVEPIATSYQISDIAEFQDIRANFSNTFSVPKTENNISRLGNSDLITTNSYVAYRKNPTRYLSNGIDILDNGFSIIEDAGDNFSISTFSGNFDFFSQLADKKISDLDCSELDHVYNLVEVASINSYNENIVFPLVQLGAYENNGVVDITWQMPALKHIYLMRKIFEGTTWGFTGEIFVTEKYSKLILELLASDVVDSQEVLDSRSAKIGNNTFTLPYRNSIDKYFSLLAKDRFDVITTPNFDSTAGFFDRSNDIAYRYVAQKEVIVDIEFNLFFDYNKLTPLSIWKNSSIPNLEGGTVIYRSTAVVPLGQNYFDDTVSGIRLKPGETLVILTQGIFKTYDNSIYFTDGSIISQPFNKSYIKFSATKTSTIGGTLNYNALLPEIKQSDFIKNFCNLYGIQIQPNFKTNKIEFSQHKSISANPNIKDLSDKLDTLITPKIKFRRQEYGQQTWLRWGQENEDKKIGDGFFNIDDNVLELSKDMFVLDFNSSSQYQINDKNGFLFNGVEIPRYKQIDAPNYNSQTTFNQGDLTLFNNFVYEYTYIDPTTGVVPTNILFWRVYPYRFDNNFDSSNRLLYYKKIGSFDIIDGLGGKYESIQWPVAYFANASEPFDLDFTNIITREYAPFVRMMQQYKEVNAFIRLSEIDIQNLDFFTLYYIESLGNTFYLMLVDEYQSDEQSTSCILIRS